MTPFDRTLIEKAGYANGYENLRESTAERVILYSARHRSEAFIQSSGTDATTWCIDFPLGPPAGELARSFPVSSMGFFGASGEVELGRILRRAAELSMALPNQAAERFAEESHKIDAAPPSATEALRMVKQRIGQNIFRQALMDYWGGACAVTGIAVPELLRASHAKPWADCACDEERLNVFNGFLLCAHLDALFDRGLMTFDNSGFAIFSPVITPEIRQSLGLPPCPRLRWISPDHEYFLSWHRSNLAPFIS